MALITQKKIVPQTLVIDSATGKLKTVNTSTLSTAAWVPYGTPNVPSTYPGKGWYTDDFIYVSNAEGTATTIYNRNDFTLVSTGAYISGGTTWGTYTNPLPDSVPAYSTVNLGEAAKVVATSRFLFILDVNPNAILPPGAGGGPA